MCCVSFATQTLEVRAALMEWNLSYTGLKVHISMGKTRWHTFCLEAHLGRKNLSFKFGEFEEILFLCAKAFAVAVCHGAPHYQRKHCCYAPTLRRTLVIYRLHIIVIFEGVRTGDF